MRIQFENNDDVVVNFTSPTSTIPNLEGVDVPNVVTSNNIEKMATVNIITQQETTTYEDGTSSEFRVTKKLQGFTTENVSMFLSRTSSPIDRTLLSSQGQSGHLQFKDVVS